MTVSVKVAGTWRTVSQPYVKTAGAWKACSAMFVRAGWPSRYATALIPPNYLKPGVWRIAPYGVHDSTQPAPVTEGAAVRLTWAIDAGKQALQGIYVRFVGTLETTISVTCTDAPAGIPWRAAVDQGFGNPTLGNDVIGPGTSTVKWTYTTSGYSTNKIVGVHVGEAASGTTGHLVSSITATNSAPVSATAPNDVIVSPWKQVWPAVGSGALGIAGVRKAKPEYFRYTSDGSHYLDNAFGFPKVPYYLVKGDTSQVASAKVTLRFTPVAPKSPVEHTISWEAPVGWALYHVGYMDDSGAVQYYYCALTDAEATTLRGQANRAVTKVWSPKEGGFFVYMPVCWDASGVTVPMSTESAGTAGVGTDPYSGYTPFPPNRTATSALADYTVANGYSDMGNINVAYSEITIELKNSGGTVLTSWTGSLPAGEYTDTPGVSPARMGEPKSALEFYWPEEWRGLFDYIGILNPAYTVAWGRDIPNKGEAEWDVFDSKGTKIGDFRLAMRFGYPGQIEIRGVNLAPDLVGMKIMRHIVEHGIEYCPTENVIIRPPDETTKEVMKSWGWREMTELSPLSLAALPQEYRDNIRHCLWNWSDPMYNRFRDLEFPPWQEVTQ